MIPTTKTRLAKRKLEIKEVRKENQKETSKKHDKRCFEFTEKTTKDVLLKQLRVLQDKINELDREKKISEELINKLKDENAKHIETNQSLEVKIKNLEDSSTPNVIKTDSGELLMLCNECEYPAEDIFDLGEHMFEFHCSRYESEDVESFVCEICDDRFITQPELTGHNEKHHTVINNSEYIQCDLCEEKFQSKPEIMRHKKHVHANTVSSCWNYSLGNCEFGDSACWFIHSESESSKIRCKICNNIFLNKSEYHVHRKLKHTELVTPCLEAKSNTCRYGDQKCWFSHDKSSQSDNLEKTVKDNNEVILRIFDVMEKMTKRISELEKTNKI